MRRMYKTVSYFVLSLVGIIVYLTDNSICDSIVQLKKGQIIGKTLFVGGNEVNEYLGIRYAEPPTGELRFRKTKRLRKIPSTLKALKLPPGCQQYSDYPFPSYVNGSHKSEDCLYLNIWTPGAASASNKKAVLFWIYGGGFRFGSIRFRLYDGKALAAFGDIIVVTVNFRLGAFGFLTTGTDEAPGNLGLWDILEALKWVNSNIGYFGGDISRITIAGESSGSFGVGYLSISPLAKHLFSRLIMESGSPAILLKEPKENNIAISEQLALKFNCANSSKEQGLSVIDCLKDVDANDLAKASYEFSLKGSFFLPQYGDELLPKSPRRSVFSGDFRCKDLLIGNNLDEGSLIVSTTYPKIFGFFGEKNPEMNQEIAEEVTEKSIKPHLPDQQSLSISDNPQSKDVSGLKPNIQQSILNNLLQKGYNSSSKHELHTLVGDVTLLCPDVYYAEKCAEIGGNVYFFFFAHRPSVTPWAPWMGVAHFEEIQFVFGRPLIEPQRYQAFEGELSRQMIEIWSNFVKTGRPNGSWPLYSKENPVFRYLGLKNETKVFGFGGPHKENCDLIRIISEV